MLSGYFSGRDEDYLLFYQNLYKNSLQSCYFAYIYVQLIYTTTPFLCEIPGIAYFLYETFC